jgi:hypothetical protein
MKFSIFNSCDLVFFNSTEYLGKHPDQVDDNCVKNVTTKDLTKFLPYLGGVAVFLTLSE